MIVRNENTQIFGPGECPDPVEPFLLGSTIVFPAEQMYFTRRVASGSPRLIMFAGDGTALCAALSVELLRAHATAFTKMADQMEAQAKDATDALLKRAKRA